MPPRLPGCRPLPPIVGPGHAVLSQGEDGAWRLALTDTWETLGEARVAAFDAMLPDGTLSPAPRLFFSRERRPMDLGRADLFLEGIRAHSGLIADLLGDAEAYRAILAPLPEAWREAYERCPSLLLHAKAAFKLWEISGQTPKRGQAIRALAGALQENAEICAARHAGLPPETIAALEDLDRAERRKRAKPRASPATESTAD